MHNRDQNFVRAGYNALVGMQGLQLSIQGRVMFHRPVFLLFIVMICTHTLTTYSYFTKQQMTSNSIETTAAQSNEKKHNVIIIIAIFK